MNSLNFFKTLTTGLEDYQLFSLIDTFFQNHIILNFDDKYLNYIFKNNYDYIFRYMFESGYLYCISSTANIDILYQQIHNTQYKHQKH